MFEFTKEKVNQLFSIDEYNDFFEKASVGQIHEAPYDNPAFASYTAANYKRSQQIRTKVDLDKKLYNALNAGIESWTWVLITEPWCGDASFIQPVIEALCLAGQVDLRIALRDKEPEMMNAYLTNGGKSIPKLVVLDKDYIEIFQWGPRPAELQQMVTELLRNGGSSDEKLKLAHQWYRKYGNKAVQEELLHLVKNNKNRE